MPATFEAENYVLRWPRENFRRRLTELVNARQDLPLWTEQVEYLLSDAFEGGDALDRFRKARAGVVNNVWDLATPSPQKPISPERQHLVDLLRAVDDLPDEIKRPPYRSQRGREHRGANAISMPASIARFVSLVRDLDERGYFERSFGKDCVDDPRAIDPSVVIEEEIGKPDLWPVSVDRLADDEETFLDMIEVLGEFVAVPQSRRMHPYGDCGWHHDDFHILTGREIYYWMVNRLLGRTSLGLRLATAGEDRGRLIEFHGEARTDLLTASVKAAAAAVRSPLEHAISLFRRRNATEEEKRSACTTLAGILESRRSFLKDVLLRKDEGALFQLANEFDVRHRNESQKGDYDPAFLDWIFWWYLATIELTDRLVARQDKNSEEPPF